MKMQNTFSGFALRPFVNISSHGSCAHANAQILEFHALARHFKNENVNIFYLAFALNFYTFVLQPLYKCIVIFLLSSIWGVFGPECTSIPQN